MTPTAMTLLDELRAAGLHLEPRDTGKVHVRPLAALTPTRRQAILAHKAELLAVLALEDRIRAMATRWQYAPEELADAMKDARANPAGWLSCLEADEQHHKRCTCAGIPAISGRAARTVD